MRLKKVSISNFRAIESLEITFDDDVTVIVGPNAIGKTTVLEAIRLCKAALAARVMSEMTHMLAALGATSPHLPNQIRLDALARGLDKPVTIDSLYQLSDSEIGTIEGKRDQIINSLVQGRIGQQFTNPANLINFLSSAQGLSLIETVSKELDPAIARLKREKVVRLHLTIAASPRPFVGADEISQLLLATVDQSLPPNKTVFSYFPADRALPLGEVPVQLGGPDAAQQLEAHNSQAQLKYQRLKNTIFNAMVMSDQDRLQLHAEFKAIFDNIIKGTKLVGVGINNIGLLSIEVEDEAGRHFQMDGMSSGEKGLLLTFLTIARTLEPGGIVLLDEPELHLNPAVCKDLLPFISSYFAKERGLQFIMCSHSPEILAGALSSDDCGLWRIASPTRATKVRQQDHDVVEATLQHLGTSQSEGLLFKALLFVEGKDDVAILEAGYDDLLKRVKVISLGGRPEVEKSIKQLQEIEKTSRSDSKRYFLFDNDGLPADIGDSEFVKVKQLERHCIENYLLDLDALADLLMSGDFSDSFRDFSSVSRTLTEIAMKQLDGLAIRSAYRQMGFPDASARNVDLDNESIENSCSLLFSRIREQIERFSGIDEKKWKSDFKSLAEKRKADLEIRWRTDWPKLCNGKQLFDTLWTSGKMKTNKSQFKRSLMKELRMKDKEPFRALRQTLVELLNN